MKKSTLTTTRQHVGRPLIPAAAIPLAWDKAVQPVIKRMYLEVRQELTRVFTQTEFGTASDASPVSQSRIVLNALFKKYDSIFKTVAESVVDRMIASVLKNTTATLKISLADYVNSLAIDKTATNERLKEVIQASTQEAANLIRRIPARYIDEVQGEVMRSITSGNGLKDLVPYLTKRYEGDARWARHVAMDQTRKAHASISNERLKRLGVKKFKWVHSGGSNQPRQHHIELSGNIFSYDDPPVIDPRTGERGLPGVLPFCRCVAVPVFFSDDMV